MKKQRLITATLAIVMGATLVGALAACKKGPSDAEIAQKAIGSIKTLYDKTDLYETDSSFTVLGQTKVDKTLYNVTWSASSEAVDNITDYIQIGTEMDEDSFITVTVTRPTEDIEYTLTASVTVGKATETYNISRKLLGLSKVYSVAEILALDKTSFITVDGGQADNTYYSTDGKTAAYVTVKGYFIKCSGSSSGWSEQYKNYSKVYIADAANETTSSKQLYVYRIASDDVYIKADGDLQAGDLVTLQGFLSVYQDRDPQMTYLGSTSVKCIGKVRENKNDDDLAQATVDSVTLEADLTSQLTITLPEKQGDATLTWTVKAGGATVDGYKLTCPENTADTAKDVTLTVTADLNGKTASKDITVKVSKVQATETGTFKMSVVQGNLANTPKYYFKGTINSSNFGETSTEISQAADVVVESAPGGYYLKVGAKYLELNASHRMTLVDTATSAWVYNTEYSVLTWYVAGDNAMYYLGTYSEFTTISASKISYLDSDTNFSIVLAAESDTRTDAQKGQEALNAVTFPAKITNDIVLTSALSDVTLEIKQSSDNTVIALDGTVTRASEEKTVTLTIAAKVDGAEVATKDFTVIVKAAVSISAGQTLTETLDFVTNFGTYAADWSTSYTTHTVAFGEVGAQTLSGTVVLANANKQKEGNAIDDRPVLASKESNAQTVTVTLAESGLSITSVTFNLTQWGTKTLSDIHIEYTLDGETWTSCSNVITTPGSLVSTAIPDGVTKVRVSCAASGTSNVQVGLASISLTVAKTAANDAERIELAKSALQLDDNYDAGVVDLPEYPGATLEWEVTSGAASISGNKLTLDEPTGETGEVVVTVTITIGTETGTKPFNITVNRTVPTNYGTLEAPISVTEALNIAAVECKNNNDVTAQEVYMTGVVVSVVAASNGFYNYTIKDTTTATKTILVYTKAENVRAGVVAPVQNDIVKISGYIKNYNNGTIEFASNSGRFVYFESNTRGTSEIKLGNHTGATVTGLPETETALNGSTVTFTVAAESGMKVDFVKLGTTTLTGTDGSYTFTVEGNATITVETSEANAPTTVEKTLTFDNTNKRTTGTTSSQVWQENGIKFTNDKGSSSSNVNTQYYNPVRCYASSNIKVEYTGMTEIVFACSKGQSDLVTTIGTRTGVTVSTEGTSVIVKFATACNEFVVEKLKAQVQIKSITVKAQESSASTASTASVSNVEALVDEKKY